MKVGDLVRVSDDWSELDIEGFGIVTAFHPSPNDGPWGRRVSVLWDSGYLSEEFFVSLEVVCK
jgi:hypothetical protein